MWTIPDVCVSVFSLLGGGNTGFLCLCCTLFFVVSSSDYIRLYLCRSTLANYCHSSSPGWPVFGCSLTAGGPWGSNTGNYTSGEGAQTQTHTHTQIHTRWLQASLTGCLIASQELIIKLGKFWYHQSCVLMCVSTCSRSRLRAHAQRHGRQGTHQGI